MNPISFLLKFGMVEIIELNFAVICE